ECLATATSITGCDTSTATPVTESATGTFTTPFIVVTGTVGSGTCGTTSADLTCIIEVADQAQTNTAAAPITFNLPVATTTTTTAPPTKKPRKFHAAPITNLRNGSSVRLSGTGFKANEQLYAIECLWTSKGQAGCDLKTLHPVKTTASGAIPAFKFKVVNGKIGNGTCGTKKSNLKSCDISIATASKGDAAKIRIAFK
ncbi:MAG TPA: neocarzinostatin apoprotein domain-containing protein, partial [Acidimicrobiales bacterium]